MCRKGGLFSGSGFRTDFVSNNINVKETAAGEEVLRLFYITFSGKLRGAQVVVDVDKQYALHSFK